MSKTIRKFKGKQYRQGHEPCELELTRKRVERLKKTKDYQLEVANVEVNDTIKQFQKEERAAKRLRESLRQIAYEEEQAMGYDRYAY